MSGNLFFSGYYPLHHLLCIVASELMFVLLFLYMYAYLSHTIFICNTTGVTSGVGTAYSTGTPELTPGF